MTNRERAKDIVEGVGITLMIDEKDFVRGKESSRIAESLELRVQSLREAIRLLKNAKK